MLVARQVPRTCMLCRHGISLSSRQSIVKSTSKRLAKLLSKQQQSLDSVRATRSSSRQFSTSRILKTDPAESRTQIRDDDTDRDALDSTIPRSGLESAESDPETVARQTRQTFGNTLPKDFLNEEEYAIYVRLFGPPLRETTADDLEFIDDAIEVEDEDGPVKNVLLRENEFGEFEEVEFDPIELGYTGDGAPPSADAAKQQDGGVAVEEEIRVEARNQREAEAILRLKKDMEDSIARAAQQAQDELIEDEEEDILEEEEEEDKFEEDERDFDGGNASGDFLRAHPNTIKGRWGTDPSTIFLPRTSLVAPTTAILERIHHKHLREAAEKAFGGPGLPHSPATPMSKKNYPQKHIGLEASQNRMTEAEADAYMCAVMPGTYVATESALLEVRKRLGSDWLRKLLLKKGGPRVLDAGGGGSATLAWKELAATEWELMRDEEISQAQEGDVPGKYTVLTGPEALRDRVSTFLENTTFLPRLPDYAHVSNSDKLLDGGSSQNRKTYDIILAPHTLLPLKDEYKRKHQVNNLWQMLDPRGGVVIYIEKGLPRGFEAIAGARDLMLSKYIASPGSEQAFPDLSEGDLLSDLPSQKDAGMIIAPCTNHSQCPMYPVPGITQGRKDFCHFRQRYIRPPYLQQTIGASKRNHEDIQFSYVAVRRGIDDRPLKGIVQGPEAADAAFAGYEGEEAEQMRGRASKELDVPTVHPLSLPRAILPPLKRHGHVILDVCTPAGKLERWTVPRSFSKQAYRDARKSSWGDLWALGAKTRVDRRPRLGRRDAQTIADEQAATGSKKKKGRKANTIPHVKKNKGKTVYEVGVSEDGMQGIREVTRGKVGRSEREGKRTKGGRVQRPLRKRDKLDDSDNFGGEGDL